MVAFGASGHPPARERAVVAFETGKEKEEEEEEEKKKKEKPDESAHPTSTPPIRSRRPQGSARRYSLTVDDAVEPGTILKTSARWEWQSEARVDTRTQRVPKSVPNGLPRSRARSARRQEPASSLFEARVFGLKTSFRQTKATETTCVSAADASVQIHFAEAHFAAASICDLHFSPSAVPVLSASVLLSVQTMAERAQSLRAVPSLTHLAVFSASLHLSSAALMSASEGLGSPEQGDSLYEHALLEHAGVALTKNSAATADANIPITTFFIVSSKKLLSRADNMPTRADRTTVLHGDSRRRQKGYRRIPTHDCLDGRKSSELRVFMAFWLAKKNVCIGKSACVPICTPFVQRVR